MKSNPLEVEFLFNRLGIKAESNPAYKYFSQTLLNHTIDGIFSYDTSYKIILWNTAMEKITGLKKEATLGRYLFEVLPFFVETGTASLFDKALSDEVYSIPDAAFLIAETGAEGYFYANISPVKNDKDRVIAAICIFHEITKRKQAEKELEEQLLLNDKIVQTLPHIIYIFDLISQRAVFFSRKMEEMLGISLADAQDMGFQLIEKTVHPEDVWKIADRHRKLLHARDGEVIETEFRLMNAANQWRWMCASATIFKRTAQGEVQEFISTLEDITDKKNAEILLYNIVTNSRHGINVMKAVRNDTLEIVDFEYVLINKAAENIFHKGLKELKGKSMLEEFPGTVNTIFKLFKNTIETGEPFDQEQYLDTDGFKHWFRIIGTRLEESIIVTIEDITARKQAEEELKRKKMLLKETEQLASIGSWERDLMQEQIIWSDELYNIFEVDPKAPLLLQELNKKILPDDLPAIVNLYEVLNHTPYVPFHYEYRIKTDSNKIKYLSGHARSIADADGNIIKYKGYVKDITREKELQNLISKAVESSLSGILVVQSVRDGSGKIIDFEHKLINPTAEKVIGRTSHELEGKKLLELFPGVKKHEIFEKFIQVAQTGEPFTQEGYFNVDRIAMWASVVVVKLEDGFMLTFSDTTQEKRTSLQLEKVLYSSLDGIILAEAVKNENNTIIDFTYQLINKQGQKILGLSEEEVIGSRMLTLFPSLKQEELFDKYVEVAQTGAPIDIEVFYPFDGLNHWFRIVVVSIENGIVLTFSDITRRKLNELRMAENEAALQDVQELASMGSFEWDVHTERMKWSKELYTLFELSPEVVPGLTLYFEQIYPADLSSVIEIFNKVKLSPEVLFYENRIITLHKKVKFVRGRIKSVFSAAGKLIKIIGYSQDITETKQAELNLNKTLAHLQEAHTLAKMGIWSLDLTTETYHFSDECCRILGFNEGTVLPLTESDKFIHPEDISTVIHKIKKAIDTKTSFISEHRTIRPDGKLKWMMVLGRAVTNGDGITEAITGVGQDITEKKENLLVLENLNNQHEMILSSIEEGIFGLNKEGKITFVNKRAIELIGFSAEELIGNNQHELIHHTKKGGSVYAVDVCPIYQVLRTGKSAYQEDEIFWRKDNTFFPVEYTANPVTENGLLTGIVVTFKDITEKKLVKEKLESAYGELKLAKEKLEIINDELEKKVTERTLELSRKNEELKRINTDLDNFIYTASHDLKAPINNIEGLVNLLNKMSSNDSKTRKILGLINDSVIRFKNTLKDLTEIAREQSSYEEANQTEKVSLELILEEIKQDIKELLISSKASIVEELTVPDIRFSKKNIRSILYNLISNSIKYSHPERIPLVIVRTYRQDSQFVVLSVADNGLGIKEEDQPKLFAMFKRLHTHVEGTGVGLYIIKRMIENAGGKIVLESEIGKGSIFKVYLKAGEDR